VYRCNQEVIKRVPVQSRGDITTTMPVPQLTKNLCVDVDAGQRCSAEKVFVYVRALTI
jgi:hypothetical protein